MIKLLRKTASVASAFVVGCLVAPLAPFMLAWEAAIEEDEL